MMLVRSLCSLLLGVVVCVVWWVAQLLGCFSFRRLTDLLYKFLYVDNHTKSCRSLVTLMQIIHPSLSYLITLRQLVPVEALMVGEMIRVPNE